MSACLQIMNQRLKDKQMRAQGIYSGVDIDDYHSEHGISSSGISLILDCPKRYWHEYLSGKAKDVDSKLKDKFALGRAVHALVLEPENFNANFYPMDEEVNLTTKIGKEIYAKAMGDAKGRQIIRYSDWVEIKSISDAVKSHSLWDSISLKYGMVEQSVYWDAGVFNTRLRARPDFYNDKIVIDLKTTDSIANFSKSVHNYGYHRQATMQLDGLKAIDGKDRHFAFFVVEKKAPHMTACFVLDEGSLEQGRKEYISGAAIYADCMKSNKWPGYEEKFQLLTLPTWAMKGDNNE